MKYVVPIPIIINNSLQSSYDVCSLDLVKLFTIHYNSLHTLALKRTLHPHYVVSVLRM